MVKVGYNNKLIMFTQTEVIQGGQKEIDKKMCLHLFC